MLRRGILASHQGTNFQTIADACNDGGLKARVVALICNNSHAPVMDRAARLDIPAYHLSSATHPQQGALDTAIHDRLTSASVQLVVLAGYMKKLGPKVLEGFNGRIINVHPSLLPKHGGQGFYGMRVHEAVIAAGDRETGATVHQVTADYDEGDVIRQESISVTATDTPNTIAEKVHTIEYRLLLETIREFTETL